jgi:hypothetical protein
MSSVDAKQNDTNESFGQWLVTSNNNYNVSSVINVTVHEPVHKKNKSAIYLLVIPVMKCSCVLEIPKKEVGNTIR